MLRMATRDVLRPAGFQGRHRLVAGRSWKVDAPLFVIGSDIVRPASIASLSLPARNPSRV